MSYGGDHIYPQADIKTHQILPIPRSSLCASPNAIQKDLTTVSSSMLAIQMIHIHYSGKFLNLLDSDDRTPLYRVKVWPHRPQVEMARAGGDDQLPQDSSTRTDRQPPVPICTAAFKTFSLQVKLNVHGQEILLRRESPLTRTYDFESPAAGVELRWEADGALTGDYKLVDPRETVLARFRNKAFSYHEVGSFELVGELEERLKDEIVISGLAVLVMVQSLNLAAMVLVGGSPN